MPEKEYNRILLETLSVWRKLRKEGSRERQGKGNESRRPACCLSATPSPFSLLFEVGVKWKGGGEEKAGILHDRPRVKKKGDGTRGSRCL